jgi:hypothetical protein
VEELATKRKQVLILEVLGNNNSNSFVVLNNINDEYLTDSVRDLKINLANDREGCLAQISAIKAEEKLRADLDEANYRAYLEKLRERTQDADMLDLSIIDNNQRGFPSSSDSVQVSISKK